MPLPQALPLSWRTCYPICPSSCVTSHRLGQRLQTFMRRCMRWPTRRLSTLKSWSAHLRPFCTSTVPSEFTAVCLCSLVHIFNQIRKSYGHFCTEKLFLITFIANVLSQSIQNLLFVTLSSAIVVTLLWRH